MNLEGYLKTQGVEFEFVEKRATVHTADAADATGIPLERITKSLVVLGETGVLNNALRFEDEFVRHKILDVVGDLALVGYPIVGHVVAHRAGHALHTALAKDILADQDAWCLVETPAAVPDGALEPAGAPGVVRAH